jgi:hypothetical protein
VSELLQSPAFWMVISAAGMPICFWLGLRHLKVARTIDDTPTSRIRSAAQGYVEVSGNARCFTDKPNRAPLSLLPSVWWYYCIEEGRDEDNKRGWHTVSSGTSTDNFLLHDDTGHCVVDPDGAEVFPTVRRVWYGSLDWPAPGLGFESPIVGMFQRYRYTEHLIPEGGTVNVIGDYRTLGSTASLSLEQEITDLLRQWKADQPELLKRFDSNGDGLINAAEWERARQAARDQVLRELATAPAQPTLNMVSQPQDGRSFLVAGIDLKKIAKQARYKTLAAWSGCVASAGLFAWLLTRF